MQKLGVVIAGIAIVIVGILVGHFAIPPPDGNPVGFHMHGYVAIGQPAVNLSSCTNKSPCYLQLDMAFDPTAAPSSPPAPCPNASTSCFSFTNIPSNNLQATTVTVDYSGYSGNYTDYVSGVIQGSPNAPPKTPATPPR